MIQNGLPKTLKTLSVFEDFDDSLIAALRGGPRLPAALARLDPGRTVDPGLSAAFAARSLDLEKLSVSYMTNAEDFFGACLKTWTWEHLSSLALTSALLRPAGDRGKIFALLSNAAAAALQMPRLHTMVLWNGTRGNACSFVYDHRDKGRPQITWRSTWYLALTPEVKRAWQLVACQVRPSELVMQNECVKKKVGSHGDAIRCLALPCPVVAPASLWQMKQEGALRLGWYDRYLPNH